MTTKVETKSREIDPTVQVTNLLPGDASRTFNLVHPGLILAYFLIRFKPLVTDIIPTLRTNLLCFAIIQCAFAVICLPPATGSSTSTPQPPSKGGRAGKKNVAKQGNNAFVRISTAFLALILTAAAGTPILSVIIVLFGAPFTTHHAETYLCVCHIALMTAFPLFYVHGVDGRAWWEISGAFLPFDEVWGGVVGACMGAWFGAVPIPLDWDRDWQTWPITIVTGAYVGYIIGKLGGAFLLRGKRIPFHTMGPME